MARLDLIPQSWRERRRVRRSIAVLLAAVIASLFVLVIARFYIAWRLHSIEQEEIRLNAEKVALERALSANQGDYARLRGLREHMARLARSRAASVVETVLKPLDEDLSKGMRFDRLIIDLPAMSEPANKQMAYVSITGEVTQAEALELMVQRLRARPTWHDMRLSRVASRPTDGTIEFALEVQVETARPEGQGKP